ncbi:MAG: primosomal protein N' [Chloroherpetonaceae bacterium]|nr:primosomal protein N' [Chloroherpetonaceae bacterium]
MAHANAQYAFVYVEHSLTDYAYPYLIPPEFLGAVQVGSRVLVRFRRRGSAPAERLGFVSSLASELETPLPTGNEILDVFNNGEPALSPELMQLALWMADYYIAYPIEAIYAVLPSVMRIRPKETVVLREELKLLPSDEKIIKTELRRSIMKLLHQEKKLTTLQLQRRLGTKHLRLALSELERGGLIEIKKTFAQKAKPKLKTAYRLAKPLTELELLSVLNSLRRSKKQEEALQKFIQLNKPIAFAEEIGASSATMNALVEKGILACEKVTLSREFLESFSETKKEIRFTDEQAKVVRRLTTAIEQGRFQTFLLHGVTGSGKTWMYIEAIRKALEQGKSAIVLVPEISLTPQTASRFRSHFGNEVRVLHSAMSDGEKFDAWQSLKHGRAKIALGPRSAIFAPLPNLGVVIVDEEHESSYKQCDQSPRYHARDVAVMRARFENAVCILGSATPSVESFYNAHIGKYELLSLTKRADKATMPDIKLIHIARAKKVSPSLSETLYQEICRRLEKNEQVILFQNRRGYASSIYCESCGWIQMCSECSVPMVFHLQENHLRCHYCGKTKEMISHCRRCGSDKLSFRSGGTERVELELQQLFPNERILRMDLDTTSRKDAHAKILREFAEGKARILLGTQMVAKGLDFPNVTLVGALAADIGLALPDFRAGERLYALLLQVAGRAGRAGKKGEVYLQVYNVQSDIFKLLLQQDYVRFFGYETTYRQQTAYPPFSRLVKIGFSGKNQSDVQAAANDFAQMLQALLDAEQFDLLGPAPAVIAKLKGQFRYQILIKQKRGARLTKPVLRQVQLHFRKKWNSTVRLEVDVDPQNMM